MNNQKKVKLYTFLTERGIRVKAARVPELALQRVDKIDFTGQIHLSERPTNTDMILVKQGDLLISGINAAKGAVSVYRGEKDVLASIHYSSYRLDQNLINVDYLRAFLRSEAFEKLLWASTNGGIKTELKAKHLLPLEIELPPLDEQAAIAGAIKAHQKDIDELNSELTHQATLLTRLRQAVMREAVQGRLAPQEATDEPAPALLARIRAEKQRLVKEKKLRADKHLPSLSEAEMPYEVPPGWAWCRLGDLVSKMDSGWSPACLNTPAQPGSWGVLKTTAVQEMEYRAFENKALPSSLMPKPQYEVGAGDILITRAGPYQRVGVICLVESSPEKLMISDKIIRFHCVDELIHPQYIAMCIQTGASKAFLDSKKFGMAESQVNISQDNLRLTPISLPPLVEQRRIVTKVTELLAYCAELEAELQQARQAAETLHAAALREAFQPQAMMVVS